MAFVSFYCSMFLVLKALWCVGKMLMSADNFREIICC